MTIPDDFPCERYVRTVREFLARVATEVQGDSLRLSADTPCWGRFIPTTIRLASAGGESAVTSDVDVRANPRFVTGIKTVETVRCYRLARLQMVAARSYLVPPALESEREDRSAYLTAHGYPLRVREGASDHVGIAYQRLTHRERTRLYFIPDDELVALAAVLVARDRPVVAFSADGSWPRHPLVREVAGRVGCRIVRRGLDEVPKPIQRLIRFMRYTPRETVP